MDKELNLEKIHSKEDSPNSWVWVKLKSTNIKEIYYELLKNNNQNTIGREISKKINAGVSTTIKHLIKIKKAQEIVELPLIMLIEINKLSKTKISMGDIINFKCKSYNSQNIILPKKLNVKIAKILGAHVSDGYLQKNKKNSYAWKVTEGKKDIIIELSNWINESFNLKTNINYDKKDNMWICSSGNKVFCRYLEKLIHIPTGKKSHIIQEPKIIKKSNLKIRNAFLAGMLNFDGCIKTNGIVSLTSMSKDLIKDTKEILDKNKIRANICYNPKKESWIIETCDSRNKENHKKLLNFFERDTYKYKRLEFFISTKQYNIEELNKIFPEEKKSKTSLKKVYEASKRLTQFKTAELAKKCNVAKTTLYKYLYILNESGILYKEIKEITTNKNGYREVVYNFNHGI